MASGVSVDSTACGVVSQGGLVSDQGDGLDEQAVSSTLPNSTSNFVFERANVISSEIIFVITPGLPNLVSSATNLTGPLFFKKTMRLKMLEIPGRDNPTRPCLPVLLLTS